MNELLDLKITVGVTTYNRPGFLKETIHSLLQQSFRNFELIISNDYPAVAVTFDSLGIQNDSRIKIINQATNLGEMNNMNYLLDIAQGEWFVWLGDDDLLHPEFLMLANKAILNNQESNIVGFFSNYISVPCPDGVFSLPLGSNKCLNYSASNFLLDYTSQKIPLVGCYGLMHAATLKKIGGMPKLGNSVGHYSDTLIPVLLVEHGNLCWLNEPLVFYRAHPDSLSHKSTDFSAYISAETDFLENLKRVCASQTVNMKPDKLIANMIKWFSSLEWIILCRSPVLSKYAVSIIFIKYQLSTNFPRLSLRYRIDHTLYLVQKLLNKA